MSKFNALLSLTGASVIAGSTLAVSRFISMGTSVFSLQLLSMIIAAIILFLFSGKEKLKTEIKNIKKRDFIIFFFQTLFGVVFFRIFIVYGINLTKTMDAGVILSLTPVMTVIMSILFLKEKIGKKELLALVLAFTGVLIINLNGLNTPTGGKMRLIGNTMVLLAVTGESGFVILSKKASSGISSLIRSLLVCISGICLFFPLALHEMSHGTGFLREADFWILSLYTGAVLTASAYILWFRGIVHVSGTTAGIFNCLIPLSGILTVFILFGESMTQIQLSGLLFIITGVSLTVFSRRRRGKAERTPQYYNEIKK